MLCIICEAVIIIQAESANGSFEQNPLKIEICCIWPFYFFFNKNTFRHRNAMSFFISPFNKMSGKHTFGQCSIPKIPKF